ncbi:MAG: hypothetical protein JXR73_13960 [Candidatus Omnitrophica bacterium]|nr:hypothetical protein [Candidatus Omnitrophota bacterium]
MKKKCVVTVVLVVSVCSISGGQNWDIYTPFDDFENEDWHLFSPLPLPHPSATVTQNPDGTVTLRRMGEELENQTIYLTHDVSWDDSNPDVPFTFEFRVRVDELGGAYGGLDSNFDRVSIYPIKHEPNGTDLGRQPPYANGRSWLMSFDQDYIGSRYFANANLEIAEIDFTSFHVITVVCWFYPDMLQDESEPLVSFGEAFEGDSYPDRALGDHSPWDLYIDRDFSQPVLEQMPGSGWNGWGPPTVDADGIIQIGFQGQTRGQFTVDYFRTGNGKILDPNEPGTAVFDWSLQ